MPHSLERSLLTFICASALLAAAGQAHATPSYTLFESGQVRPLALSSDGQRLFAVNTPDNRLEIFNVTGDGLRHFESVQVGLEPVALAMRNDNEVWVVNHLSDSVSVVDISPLAKAHVSRTLLVGDEPRDIVFAGPGRSRAFITTARRGQNSPIDPALTTPGIGRANVWVFDAGSLGTSLGGDPLTILTLFSDTPRALAVTPDGSRVYAAAFHSGNRTTTLFQGFVNAEVEAGLFEYPGPLVNFEGIPQPAPNIGLIVKFDGLHWTDEIGQQWDDLVQFSLPDKDVFTIDATANPPVEVAGGEFTGVGTILYNMVVNPVNGNVYVANTDANNANRFEGPGIFAGHSVRGHLHESHITVLSSSGVATRHLNKHINYARCVGVPLCTPDPLQPDENAKSLALPTGMSVTADGTTLYVAALGSSKIGVFDTAQLEADTFVPSTANQIPVSGGGPTGILLDESRHRLYVMTRFDDSISVINTTSRTETAHVPMYNAEPPSVTVGRRLLYDASLTSTHGDSACASCHVFGDFDSLAWDLGNPDATSIRNPGPFSDIPSIDPDFAPMKGPMITQSLRGLANHGPMHWRGDRTGGNDAPTAACPAPESDAGSPYQESTQPHCGTFNERSAFEKFNVAFTSLLGRSGPLTDAEMRELTAFVLQITYPPNPIRHLDNSLTVDQADARNFYFTQPVLGPLTLSDGTTGLAKCNDCHVLDPEGNASYGVRRPGFFGTDGRYADNGFSQIVKVPHLRNAYQKVGMFGEPFVEDGFAGDQVRGFGFINEGSVDTIFTFLSVTAGTINFTFPPGDEGVRLERGMESFLLAYDSNLAPIVGQQVTLTADNAGVARPRIDLLVARASVGECDLVAKARRGREIGFLYTGGSFVPSTHSLSTMSLAEIELLPARPSWSQVTFTCVPPGSGVRIGLDRDGDGYYDGDEIGAGSDPANPDSTP